MHKNIIIFYFLKATQKYYDYTFNFVIWLMKRP